MMIVSSLICTAVLMVATGLCCVRTRPSARVFPGLLQVAGAWSACLLLVDLWRRGAVTVASIATLLTVCAVSMIWLRRADGSTEDASDDFQLWESELASPEVSEE